MQNVIPPKGEVKFLDRKELSQLGIKYSNTHLLKLEKEGKFPRRIALTPCKNVWRYQELVDWVESRAASRDLNGGDA